MTNALWFEILVQGLGILGMAASIISQQCRKNSNYFIFQIACNALFMGQFFLTGSYTGMILNGVNIFRSLALVRGEDHRRLWMLIALEAAYTVSTVVSLFLIERTVLNIVLAILVWIAQIASTLFVWSCDGKKMRYGQLFAISPIWLVYDAFAKSIGGVLCEVFNIVSIIIALIRYRKVGFIKN